MGIVDLVLDIFSQIGRFLMGVASWFYERFMDLPFFEKMITISFIPAFFAIVLPIARHRLFAGNWYINNSLAVYMIGIVFIMAATHFYPGKISLAVRILLNVYYLFWVIYIHASGDIAKTEYSLMFGYYLNIAVPILLAVLSVLSFFNNPD